MSRRWRQTAERALLVSGRSTSELYESWQEARQAVLFCLIPEDCRVYFQPTINNPAATGKKNRIVRKKAAHERERGNWFSARYAPHATKPHTSVKTPTPRNPIDATRMPREIPGSGLYA